MTFDLFQSASEMAEERAAIREFDGLMTREDAERLGKLDAEEWRHACEVRHVLAMPSRLDRADYLKLVDSRRGKDAGQRLRDSVQREWVAQRASIAAEKRAAA